MACLTVISAEGMVELDEAPSRQMLTEEVTLRGMVVSSTYYSVRGRTDNNIFSLTAVKENSKLGGRFREDILQTMLSSCSESRPWS